MKLTKKQTKELDERISDLYRTHGDRKQISVLDIGKLFNDARVAYTSGVDLEQAVIQCVQKYCK